MNEPQFSTTQIEINIQCEFTLEIKGLVFGFKLPRIYLQGLLYGTPKILIKKSFLFIDYTNSLKAHITVANNLLAN